MNAPDELARPPKVVYTDVSDLDPAPGVQLLSANGFDVRILSAGISDDELGREIAEADAVVCGYRRLSAAMLSAAPALKIITTLSVGTDMVDIEAATDLGIQVCNVPPLATEEVATHALALMLAQERHLERGAQIVRSAQWDAVAFGAPRRLSELTLGLIGFGRIGREFARMAGPLFARVLAFDPHMPPRSQWGSAIESTFDEVIGEADVISLHLPLTPASERMLGAAEFARMKPGVGILNVSRGALIDHDALIEGIESGRIGYAGLDVTDPEPPEADSALRSTDRLLVTPHVAFASEVTLRGYALAPAREIVAWFAGEDPISPVNGVLPKQA